MDPSRLLLPFSVGLLALTQVPAALESLSMLDCQRQFLAASKVQGPLVRAVAVQFCNGTSQQPQPY